MEELYDCNKYLKIPWDTLWKMRVRDRRYIISKHNRENAEQASMSNNTNGTNAIDKFTDLAQKNLNNV